MSRDEMIMLLGNALVKFESVWTRGESCMDAQSSGMKDVRKVFRALREEKEAEQNEKRHDA